jgi:uncharacterized OsmC-like protein
MTTTEGVSELNGLDRAHIESVIESLKDENALREFSGPWRSRVTWESGFKAKAHTRTHVVSFDEPEGLGTNDTAASAHEHLLSAIGACVTVGFILNATRQGIKVDNLEIQLEGHFQNILKWADLDDEGNPGYGAVAIKGYVQADAEEEQLRAIWQKAVAGSPVLQSVSRPTEVRTELAVL